MRISNIHVFHPRLKYNVRSNEAKWPQKSGWIKSHFWLSQPNQACDTIFSIRIWCSTTFSLTVWRNSAKWRFRQFFYPLFCGHLASFFRTSCFRKKGGNAAFQSQKESWWEEDFHSLLSYLFYHGKGCRLQWEQGKSCLIRGMHVITPLM